MATTYHPVRIAGAAFGADIAIVRVTPFPDGTLDVGCFTLAAAPFVQREMEQAAAIREGLADTETRADTAAIHRDVVANHLGCALAILQAVEAAQKLLPAAK